MAGSPLTVAVPGGQIALPPIKLQPITDSANAAALASVREGYSNRVAIGANTAAGGSLYLKGSVVRDRLTASGYLTASRQQGVAAGGELSWDLRPR